MIRDDDCVIRDEALFDSVWQKPQIAVVMLSPSRQLTKTLSTQSIDETLLPDSCTEIQQPSKDGEANIYI